MAADLATRATVLINQSNDHVDSASVHAAVAEYTAGPDFPAQFANVNRSAHDWIFTGAHTQSGGDQLFFDLGGMFEQIAASNNVELPEALRAPVAVSTPKELRPGALRPLATWGRWASLAAVVLTGVFAVLSFAAARSPGRVVAGLGISALLVGAAGWIAIELARSQLNDTLNNTTGGIRGITDAMVGQAQASLHNWLDVTLAAGGGLVLVGVLVAGVGGFRRS
jgi:hypothetical protein